MRVLPVMLLQAFVATFLCLTPRLPGFLTRLLRAWPLPTLDILSRIVRFLVAGRRAALSLGPAPPRLLTPFSVRYCSSTYQGQSACLIHSKKKARTSASVMSRKLRRSVQQWYCMSAHRAPKAKLDPMPNFKAGVMITTGIQSGSYHSNSSSRPPRRCTKRKKSQAHMSATCSSGVSLGGTRLDIGVPSANQYSLLLSYSSRSEGLVASFALFRAPGAEARAPPRLSSRSAKQSSSTSPSQGPCGRAFAFAVATLTAKAFL